MFRNFLKLYRPFSQFRPNVPKHSIKIDMENYRLTHPIWDLKEAERVSITHRKPENTRDWIANGIMRCLRLTFDFFSGYRPGKMTEALYLRRFIFLETIAAVPGMVGGAMRHTFSLISFKQDRGWIHHLLAEAENERMHLFTFLDLRKPGVLMRAAIVIAQSIFVVAYTLMYFLSTKTAHRFVGYLEEEAVKTYTNCIKELDEGKLSHWQKQKAPEDAIRYWDLPQDAVLRDVLLSVRADEAMHREVNHHLASLDYHAQIESYNPAELYGKEQPAGKSEQPPE